MRAKEPLLESGDWFISAVRAAPNNNCAVAAGHEELAEGALSFDP